MMQINHLAKRLLGPVSRRAPPFIMQWWRERRADLYVDPAQFLPFSERLMPYMEQVAATKFYRYVEQTNIPGWMTPKERQALYAIAKHLPGRITEIGSWVGLSTTAIASGIRDSGVSKAFCTYDLRLTEISFRPVEGGLGLFLADDETVHGVCSEESYQRDILPVLRFPGGSNAMLKKHLAALGLLDYVDVQVGDFRSFPPIISDFVFCDALHDESEIVTNAPALAPWLRSGSVLACHDVGASEKLIDALRGHIKLGYGTSVDSLYIAEVT